MAHRVSRLLQREQSSRSAVEDDQRLLLVNPNSFKDNSTCGSSAVGLDVDSSRIARVPQLQKAELVDIEVG